MGSPGKAARRGLSWLEATRAAIPRECARSDQMRGSPGLYSDKRLANRRHKRRFAGGRRVATASRPEFGFRAIGPKASRWVCGPAVVPEGSASWYSRRWAGPFAAFGREILAICRFSVFGAFQKCSPTSRHANPDAAFLKRHRSFPDRCRYSRSLTNLCSSATAGAAVRMAHRQSTSSRDGQGFSSSTTRSNSSSV